MPAARYKVSPRVINETIDGEAVMINLASGNYYILDPIGAEIWTYVERAASVGEIVDGLSARYEGSSADIESAVDGLLTELQGEDLVVPADGENGSAHAAAPAAATGDRQPFATPKLEKFTDMQDLILIDPVHQVDEAGWPHAKPGGRG
ncbi:MAG: PqqD family protein [Actinomycetota bacterium]